MTSRDPAPGRLVWVIDPDKRRAVVYRSLSEAQEIASSDILEEEDVLR